MFDGGVQASHACLEALCEMGLRPEFAITYDRSRRNAAGYMDFGQLASKHQIDLVRTHDLNDPEIVRLVALAEPVLVFVIGWSQLVGKELLAVPQHGCVGIHPTRLPEGRGRAPIPWTILKDLKTTASTMFFLGEGVDDGPIIGQVGFRVDPREDAGTLYAKHLDAHVNLIRRYATVLLEGDAFRTPQAHGRATVWPKRTPEDGLIDWTQPAVEVDRLIRAVTRPYPGAFTEGMRVWKAEIGPNFDASPGTVIDTENHSYVVCGEGSIRVLEADVLVRSARWHAFTTV